MFDTSVIEDNSVIHSEQKSWRERAIDSARGATKRRPSIMGLFRHFLPDVHEDVPWQQNNNAEPPRQSTTCDESKRSLRSSKSLLGSLRGKNRSSFNWSYSRRPKLHEARSSNNLTGSVRSVTDKLRRKMSKTDELGIVTGGSSPKTIPGRGAHLESPVPPKKNEHKTGRPSRNLDDDQAYRNYRRRSGVDDACLGPTAEHISPVSSSSSEDLKVPNRSVIQSPLPGTNASMSPATTPQLDVAKVTRSNQDPLERRMDSGMSTLRLTSEDPFVNSIKPQKLRESTHDSGYESKHRGVHFAEPMPARRELSDSTEDESIAEDKIKIRSTYTSSSEGYSSSDDEEGSKAMPRPLVKCFAPMDQVTSDMSVTRIGDKKLPDASRKAAELHKMPTSEKVKRQVISSTSCQIIEGNTFQVTVYKSGFWKGANYQLRPRGRYVPNGVDFPRVFSNNGRRHLRESSSDSDDVLDIYGDSTVKRPEERGRIPSEELFKQEAALTNLGVYDLKRCKARDEPAPADDAEKHNVPGTKRKVSLSLD